MKRKLFWRVWREGEKERSLKDRLQEVFGRKLFMKNWKNVHEGGKVLLKDGKALMWLEGCSRIVTVVVI